MIGLKLAVLIGGGYGSSPIRENRTALAVFLLNSIIEAAAFAYIIYDTGLKQQVTVSTALALISSELRVFVSFISRLWIVRKLRYIQQSVNFQRGEKIHTHRLFPLAFAIFWSWNVYERVLRPDYNLLRCVLEMNVVFVTIGRYHATSYIMCLYLLSLHEKLQREVISAVAGSFQKHENAYKRCCALLQTANSRMDNIHDCFCVTCFVYISTVDAMAVLAPCDLVRNVISSVCASLIPLATVVALADRISSLMETQRSRLRLLWVREHPSVNIYAVLRNQRAFGVRWLMQSKVMNFSTALEMLSNIATYGSLILTTPLFQEASSYVFFCPTYTDS